MNIDAIQYQNTEQTALRVTTTEGKTLTVPWPCRTWHNEAIQEWLAAGGVITELPGPTLEEARTAKLAEINGDYTATLQPYLKDYPEYERLGWLQQRVEATSYLRWYQGDQWGEAPETPNLDRILAGRNADGGTETLAQLSAKVIKHAENFTLLQELTGHRHRLEKQAEAATTVAELDAIVPDFAGLLA